MPLLIVESPAKCKKIAEYLGAGWRVRATMGHIRALTEDLTAIGFKAGADPQIWSPTYETIKTKAAAITALRREAAGTTVYLGSDDDREGEAIAWHTCSILGLDPATTPRVIFHEITEKALKDAVAAPGRINMNKFNAQQARTMLDMLIGFTLSPCLWRGVGYKAGLSAGRCQTPALRIIYDRDQEIAGHTAVTSWRIQVATAAAAAAATDTEIIWSATEDQPGEAAATALLNSVAPAPHTLTITDRDQRVSSSKPPAPFITSSLQQEASSRLGMAPKTTMRAAQTLYEAGHITYMRTDNAVLSVEATTAAVALVSERWGAVYVGGGAEAATVKKVVKRKPKAGAAAPAPAPEAQAAHEAIRPTHMEISELTDMGASENRLYALIWRRTIQSVMAPETRDVVSLKGHFTVAPTVATLKTDWDRTAFAGWRVLDYDVEKDAAEITMFEARRTLQPDTTIPWTTVTANETHTSPPPRYTEASLIRDLESRGIGRPSTFATLVETVLERGYVEKNTVAAAPVTLKGLLLAASAAAKATKPKATTRTERAGGERDKLRVTPLGRTVIEWLLEQFGDMLEYGFTAAMETQLDEVSRGVLPWDSVLTGTWDRYKARYATIMAPGAPGAGAGATPRANSRVAEYGDGYKMVISKKGPLFVLETEGAKTRFASVPAGLSLQTATRADAEAAFGPSGPAGAGAGGELLGAIDDAPVHRKKGPYGHYAEWKGKRISCKPDETFEEISSRLSAAAAAAAAPDAVDHQVGPYKIRRGPYGLYMFKITTGATKPRFVSIPAETPWSTLTPETAEQVYKLASAAKAEAAKTATRSKKAQGPAPSK